MRNYPKKRNCMINRKYIFISLLLLCITRITSSTTKFIFSHGIVDSYKQAFWYAKEYSIDNVRYSNERYFFTNFVTFNYPDAFDKLYDNPFWFTETSLGQDNELRRLNLVYNKVKKQTDEIVLFGLSRGASAIFNFVEMYKPSHIKAIVAESPYDCVATMIDNILIKCGLTCFPHSWGECVTECIFRKYNRNGIHPCNALDTIPHDLPILIVCSKEDTLIPWTSSYEIYKKLRMCGHKNVHIFIADHGKHAKILSDSDGEKYHTVVHAFFKHYNLPHDPSIAVKGKIDFELCQPNIE